MPRYECCLCGRDGTGDEVSPALIVWLADGRDTYDSGPRCRDHQACRDRLEATGEAWPVDDGGRTRPTVRR